MYIDEERKRVTRRMALKWAVDHARKELWRVEQDMYDAGFTGETNKYLNRVDILRQLEILYYQPDQLELPNATDEIST